MKGSLTCTQLVITDAVHQLGALGQTGDQNLDMGTSVTTGGHFFGLVKPELYTAPLCSATPKAALHMSPVNNGVYLAAACTGEA